MKFDRIIKTILEKVESIDQLENKFDDKNVNNFIDDLVKICKDNNIKLELSNTEKVTAEDNLKCNGYFDGKKLVVATKNPLNLWLRILVHESCHIDQLLEDKEWYNNTNEHVSKIDKWLKDSKKDFKDKDESYRSVAELELDCEKRAINKIKKYNLPIDIKEYTKEANEYILGYMKSKKTGKWDDGTEPLNKKLRESMPTKFLSINDYINLNHPEFNVDTSS
jgi:hypothetical protein